MSHRRLVGAGRRVPWGRTTGLHGKKSGVFSALNEQGHRGSEWPLCLSGYKVDFASWKVKTPCGAASSRRAVCGSKEIREHTRSRTHTGDQV